MNTTDPKQDQKRFIAELSQTVLDDMYTTIDAGKVPANWDGHELRQWLQDRFTAANFGDALRGSRRRAYKNTVLVNNL